jgi:hypothetical protein
MICSNGQVNRTIPAQRKQWLDLIYFPKTLLLEAVGVIIEFGGIWINGLRGVKPSHDLLNGSFHMSNSLRECTSNEKRPILALPVLSTLLLGRQLNGHEQCKNCANRTQPSCHISESRVRLQYGPYTLYVKAPDRQQAQRYKATGNQPQKLIHHSPYYFEGSVSRHGYQNTTGLRKKRRSCASSANGNRIVLSLIHSRIHSASRYGHLNNKRRIEITPRIVSANEIYGSTMASRIVLGRTPKPEPVLFVTIIDIHRISSYFGAILP